MVNVPAAQPTPRVFRSRRDDRFDAGHPAPAKRANAGWVQSVEDAYDSCTVVILDEVIPGVVFLHETPEPGDIVEVEARGDLLVIVNQWPGPPPWLELGPPFELVMCEDGYTTVEDFNPFLGEFRGFSGVQINSMVEQATFGPAVTADPDAWACVWSHATVGDKVEAGNNWWNSPPNEPVWTGDGTCTPPRGPHTVGGGGVPVGWQVGGGCSVITQTGAMILNYATVFANRFSGYGPSAGYTVPTPPPDYVLEWEGSDTDVDVFQIDACLAEGVSAPSNDGEVYWRKFGGTFGAEFGPNPADAGAWSAGRCAPGGIGPYSGGTDTWTDVTDLIEPTGSTWWLLLPDVLAAGEQHWSVGAPPAGLQAYRYGLTMAFRFHLRPRRYRFVPVP